MSEVKNYRCPCCSGVLSFEPGSDSVVCESCNNTIPIKTVETYGERMQFDWSSNKENIPSEHLENSKVYICQSCGAVIETTGETVAAKCPYCESNVVLTDRVSGSLKPNAIIPFKIKPSELYDAVKRFYKGKRLLPKDFFSRSKLAEIQGIYVPFWLFSCKLKGVVNLYGKIVSTYSDSSYDYVETASYLMTRDGEMEFQNVPVDASIKMENDLMDSIEPYDFSEMKPFNEAYLAGYLADRYDSDPDAELERVNARMQSSAHAALLEEESMYSSVRVRDNGMKMEGTDIRYVLLPVYIIYSEYRGRKYKYAVNGQTGKIVGELPISKAKMWKIFTLCSIPLAILGFFIGLFTQW